jgi:hypothetical protein
MATKKTTQPKPKPLVRLDVDAFNDACAERGAPSFRTQARLLGLDQTSIFRARGGQPLGSRTLSAIAREFGIEALPKLLRLS